MVWSRSKDLAPPKSLVRGDCIKHSLIESFLILITCSDQKCIMWSKMISSRDRLFGSFCCVRDYEPCNWANLFLLPSTSEDSASCADIAFWTSVKSFGCSWLRLKIDQTRSNGGFAKMTERMKKGLANDKVTIQSRSHLKSRLSWV